MQCELYFALIYGLLDMKASCPMKSWSVSVWGNYGGAEYMEYITKAYTALLNCLDVEYVSFLSFSLSSVFLPCFFVWYSNCPAQIYFDLGVAQVLRFEVDDAAKQFAHGKHPQWGTSFRE